MDYVTCVNYSAGSLKIMNIFRMVNRKKELR